MGFLLGIGVIFSLTLMRIDLWLGTWYSVIFSLVSCCMLDSKGYGLVLKRHELKRHDRLVDRYLGS